MKDEYVLLNLKIINAISYWKEIASKVNDNGDEPTSRPTIISWITGDQIGSHDGRFATNWTGKKTR